MPGTPSDTAITIGIIQFIRPNACIVFVSGKVLGTDKRSESASSGHRVQQIADSTDDVETNAVGTEISNRNKRSKSQIAKHQVQGTECSELQKDQRR